MLPSRWSIQYKGKLLPIDRQNKGKLLPIDRQNTGIMLPIDRQYIRKLLPIDGFITIQKLYPLIDTEQRKRVTHWWIPTIQRKAFFCIVGYNAKVYSTLYPTYKSNKEIQHGISLFSKSVSRVFQRWTLKKTLLQSQSKHPTI